MSTLPFVMTSCGDDDDLGGSIYYYYDTKIPITVINDKAVVFYYLENEEALTDELSKHNLTLTHTREYVSRIALDEYPEKVQNFYRDLMIGYIEGKYKNYLSTSEYTVVWSPFYRMNGREAIPTMNFSVRVKEGVEYQQVVGLAEQYNVIIDNAPDYDYIIDEYPWGCRLTCTKESKGNTIELAAIFYESGLFEYIEVWFAGLDLFDILFC